MVSASQKSIRSYEGKQSLLLFFAKFFFSDLGFDVFKSNSKVALIFVSDLRHKILNLHRGGDTILLLVHYLIHQV